MEQDAVAQDAEKKGIIINMEREIQTQDAKLQKQFTIKVSTM